MAGELVDLLLELGHALASKLAATARCSSVRVDLDAVRSISASTGTSGRSSVS